MAVTSGFFNSKNHDRKYNATQMSSLFEGIIKDGVFQSVGNIFKVTASTDMSVTVDTGRAWFNGTWTNNDALIVLTLSEAEQVLKRIDAVILEVNTEESVRANTIKIKKGTPGSSPVPPTLTKSDTIYQYPLAYITIDPNDTTITQAKIENKVGSSDCPFVTGLMEAGNIDNLISQWSTEFNILFAQLEEQISQAVSGTIIDKSVTFQKLANDAVKRVLHNKSISIDSFVSDTTYTDYPYRASIPIIGVTTNMIPEVILGADDVLSGNYAPVADTYNGGIYIYAASQPEAALTIPTIIVWREGVGTW